jgi:hypothetical protein
MGGTPGTKLTEGYDGTSWTSLNSKNAGSPSGDGGGTQTSAIHFLGNSNTEEWNGTNWNTLPQMANARIYLSGCGTASLALGFGGYASGVKNQTEEFTGETTSLNLKTITDS